MPDPNAVLQTLRTSTADLIAGLSEQQWSDDDVRMPSLCDGWSRAHVLTHLARNADGVAGTLAGALRGSTVAQYPDGWEARGVAIEAGSSRPATVIMADLVAACDRLDRVFGAVAEAQAWSAVADKQLTTAEWADRRLREVEIHRVDLAGDYTPDHWPPLLVVQLLPAVVDTVPERTDRSLHITVAERGSVAPDLVGASWRFGADPADVAGPDWAVLAWLVGRLTPSVADQLSATPDLASWR